MINHDETQDELLADELASSPKIAANLASHSKQTIWEISRPLTYLSGIALVLGILVLIIALAGSLGAKSSLSLTIATVLALLPIGIIASLVLVLYFTKKILKHHGIHVDSLSTIFNLQKASLVLIDQATLSSSQSSPEKLIIGQSSYHLVDKNIINDKGHPLADDELKNIDIFLAAAEFTDKKLPSVITDKNDYPEIKRLDDSSRTISLRRWGNSRQPYAFVRGSAEDILASCDELWDHGHNRKLVVASRKKLVKTIYHLETDGYQVTALAYRRLETKDKTDKLTADYCQNSLTWLGLVISPIDIDDSTVLAMHTAHRAGLKLVVFSNYSAKTAQSLAVRAGLASSSSDLKTVTNQDIDNLTHGKLLQLITSGQTIFTNVKPNNQLLITELARANDQILASCLASAESTTILDNSDISLSPKSQQASKHIFVKLMLAIHYSRNAKLVIGQTIRLGLTANVAMSLIVLTSLATMLAADIPPALTSNQILAIVLLAQILPLATLVWDKPKQRVVRRRSHNDTNRLFNLPALLASSWTGLLIAVLALASYFWFYANNNVDPDNLLASSQIHWQAMTIVSLALLLSLLANTFFVRHGDGLLNHIQPQNWRFWLAGLVSVLIMLILTYGSWTAPYFQLASLDASGWLYAIVATGLFVLISWFEHHTRRHSHHELILRHGHAKIKHHLASSKTKVRAH